MIQACEIMREINYFKVHEENDIYVTSNYLMSYKVDPTT